MVPASMFPAQCPCAWCPGVPRPGAGLTFSEGHVSGRGRERHSPQRTHLQSSGRGPAPGRWAPRLPSPHPGPGSPLPQGPQMTLNTPGLSVCSVGDECFAERNAGRSHSGASAGTAAQGVLRTQFPEPREFRVFQEPQRLAGGHLTFSDLPVLVCPGRGGTCPSGWPSGEAQTEGPWRTPRAAQAPAQDSRPARGHCPASAHDSVWVFFPVFPSYHTDMFPSLLSSGVSVMLCWTRAVTFLQKQPSSALHQLRSEARSLHLFLFNEQTFLQEGGVAAEASRTS